MPNKKIDPRVNTKRLSSTVPSRTWEQLVKLAGGERGDVTEYLIRTIDDLAIGRIITKEQHESELRIRDGIGSLGFAATSTGIARVRIESGAKSATIEARAERRSFWPSDRLYSDTFDALLVDLRTEAKNAGVKQ